MANIMEILGRIKTAIYGRDVRQSIYDAILQCYNDATGNPESIAAHVGDTENPHDVTAEQIGLKTAAADISALQSPEFEDYTADGATVPDARTAISEMTSKMSMFTFLGKAKAALMGLVTLGEMRALLVNNGLTTESGKYFLDAAYGKTLLDLYTKLNSERVCRKSIGTFTSENVGAVTGHVTTAGKEAFLYFPMVWECSVSSVNITELLSSIRTVQGTYLGGKIGVNLVSYITSTKILKSQGILQVVLTNNDGWGVTNNTPLAGSCGMSYTIK